MRTLTIIAFAVSFEIVGMTSAFSQTGMKNGSAPVGMKARCSPGDPNVLVNRATKAYSMDTPAKAPKSKSGMMGAGMDSTAGERVKSGMVSMCKSEAMSMGAKMKKKAM